MIGPFKVSTTANNFLYSKSNSEQSHSNSILKKVMDSTGKIRDGIIDGNTKAWGNPLQCFAVSVEKRNIFHTKITNKFMQELKHLQLLIKLVI